MSICFFTAIFPPRFGGGTIQAINLAKELKRKGKDIFFVTLTDELSQKGKGTYEDFDVYYIYFKKMNSYLEGNISRYNQFSLIIKILTTFIKLRNKYTIIHIHGIAYPFIYLSILAKLIRKKIIAKVAMLHEVNFRDFGRITGRISEFSALRLDKIIVISSMIKKKLLDSNFSKPRVLYVPNGVDAEKYIPLPPDQKKILKARMNVADKTVITFIGAITYRKGADQLVSIWPAIAERYPESCLIMVGPRSKEEGATGERFCYQEILQHIKKEEIQNCIHLTGKVSDVSKYLQIADLFAFPSTMEGMPNVILESMSCGVPAISYRVSGVDDIIINGENGRIIENGDKSTFKKTVIELLHDEDKRKYYSQQARKRIVEKFSLDYVSDQYIKVYHEL